MDASVDVGVVVPVVTDESVDDRLWLLRSRSIVQIDEGLPVDLLPEGREVSSNGDWIETSSYTFHDCTSERITRRR